MTRNLHFLCSILRFVIFCLLTFTLTVSLVPSALGQFSLSASEDLKRDRNTINIFENVTTDAGIKWAGDPGSFSTAWTDFNSDGLLDLWVSPHIYQFNGNDKNLIPVGSNRLPKLYLNQGDGTFNNILPQIWPSNVQYADAHGTAWADFDNDGDPDLMVMTGAEGGGGTEPKRLFINEEGVLQEKGVALGVDFPNGRGRSPLWFDWNKDGWLDLLEINNKRPDGEAPTTLFQQTVNGFQNVNVFADLRVCTPTQSAQVADLFGNRAPDIVLLAGENDSDPNPTKVFVKALLTGEQNSNTSPVKVYENSELVLKDVTATFPRFTNVRDFAIADFNGDLIDDIFFVRSITKSPRFLTAHHIDLSDLYQEEQNLAFARLKTKAGEVGISFKTRGRVTFDSSFYFFETKLPSSEIFIGSKGGHPSKPSFSLSSNDPTAIGILPRDSRNLKGLYIGYDPARQSWQVFFANPESNDRSLNLILTTSEMLTDLTPIGFTPEDHSKEALPPVLLMYDSKSGQYVDRTRVTGLDTPLLGKSVVTGDFDNDMDVDLLISSSSLYVPLPTTFYENQGNGTFIRISNAAGAAGNPVGPRAEYFDVGLNLAVADYDVDGFLDLYTAESTIQGHSQNYLGSPPQLFHNIGNSNHWLEIDLQGTNSNRDGIGTKVLATTGGITQLREQNGGMHTWGQNQQRLHFGLGINNQVDRLVIQWPSGQVQELTNIAADQVIRILEPAIPGNNTLEKRGGNSVVSDLQDNNSFVECSSPLPLKKIVLMISIFSLGSLLGLLWLVRRKSRMHSS